MNSLLQDCSYNHSRVHWSGGRKQASRDLRRALLITSLFMVVEFLGGLWTRSLALLADSGHMLTDAGALALSLFAAWIVQRPSSPEKTYGYFRAEILAALLNGSALVLISLWILYEAYHRLVEPVPVRSLEMMLIAAAGLAVNLAVARILHSSQGKSLNIRGAFLHVLGDLLGSLGALSAGLLMLVWGFYWADPAASVLVSFLILFNAWKLVRDSVSILLEGAPAHVNLAAMREALTSVPGVRSVHDLHVWTLTSGIHAMTCHAVVEGEENRDAILDRLSSISRERFHIHHTTIQIEKGESSCGQLPPSRHLDLM